MSNHVSIARSVSIYKGSYNYNEDSENSIICRTTFDFYCMCGCSVGILIDKDFRSYTRPTPTCPSCGKESDVSLNMKNFRSNTFTDYTKVWDNGEKVRFQLAFTRIFQNKYSGKLFFKKERISICYNTLTKNIYLTYGKNLVNWSYATTSAVNKRAIDALILLLSSSDKTKDDLIEFFKLCYAKINIQYADIESICCDIREMPSVASLRNAITLLKFPFLENINLPEPVVYCDSIIPHAARKHFKNIQNKRDFFSKLFNLNDKKAIEIFYENGFRAETVYLKQLIDSNNLEYFWEQFNQKFGKISHTSSSLISAGKLAHLTSKHNLKKNNELTDYEKSYLSFEMLRSFYKKDKPFIDCLLNNVKKNKMSLLEKNDDDTYLMKTKEYHSQLMWHEIVTYLSDAYMMKQEISKHLPNVEINFEGNIIKYHDDLAREHRRIQVNITDFLYSEEEKNHYNDKLEHLEFRLLNSSIELTETGIKLDNCVGGYVNRTINRECYIVVAYHNNQPLACLELFISKGKVYASQAYSHSNSHLFVTDATVVATYLLSKGVSFANCPELVHVLPENFPTTSSIQTPTVSESGFVESTDIFPEVANHGVDLSKFGLITTSTRRFEGINSYKETEVILTHEQIIEMELQDSIHNVTPQSILDTFDEFLHEVENLPVVEQNDDIDEASMYHNGELLPF